MTFRLTTIAAAAMAMMPMAGHAQELTWASGWPPGGFIPNAVDKAAAYITENSDLQVKHFPLSLLSFTETVSGLGDGVVDFGYVLMPYFPAEFSETNLASDLTMLATSGTPTKAPGLAMTGALAEYIMLDCAECQAEFAVQNQVYLAGGATTEYRNQCDRTVATVADMKGLKIRNGAANFGRYAEKLGAVKVAISGGEIYEAMSANAIDCAMVAIPELLSLRLIEVVKAITMGAPGGVFAGTGSANVNMDVWNEMSPEQRDVVLHAASQLSADIAVGYVLTEKDAMQQAKDAGIEFIDAAPDLVAATEEFVKEDIDTIGEQYKSSYNVADVDAKIEKITALIEKWKGLVDPVAEDAAGFEKILWDEIYSKIDVNTYGVN
ncbi:C4-dicarboxylate TRAP transporter substrate-binding protein [Yoonia sp.]|jgi:TRAP-type transport system periplasmic protein|uniref:C4-dicarboxylate TRAP transporter substrate-binding protein n=1 Tax=Yoonia sp. TaxID=2212373 RepID=UPI004048C1EE